LNLGFEALKIRLELLPEPLVTGQTKTVEHTVVFAPGHEAGAEKILPALAQMTEELPRRSAKRSARTHPIPAARKDGRPANRLPTAEADAVPSL
jgi:hypothetical protein